MSAQSPRPGVLASVAPCDDPRLPWPTEPRIQIACAGAVDIAAPLVLAGVFAVTAAEHDSRAAAPHRDLVLTVHREPFYAVRQPFRDSLVFADDVAGAGPLRIGGFRVDVWSCCAFRVPGRYYLRVSLGMMLSNVCDVLVGP